MLRNVIPVALAAGIASAAMPIYAAQPADGAQDYSARINVAGRQRMLVQRAAKSTCLAYQEVHTGASIKESAEAIKTFEQTMRALIRGNDKRQIAAEENADIRAVEKVVLNDFRKMVKSAKTDFMFNKVTEKGYASVRENEMDVLKKTMGLVTMMVETYGASDIDPDIAKTINLSGKQRMLSQKMVKEICYIASAQKAGEVSADVDSLAGTVSLFETSMNKLINGDPADGIIEPPSWEFSAQFELVMEKYAKVQEIFHRAANGGNVSKADLEAIAVVSEEMLTELENATWLYTQL